MTDRQQSFKGRSPTMAYLEPDDSLDVAARLNELSPMEYGNNDDFTHKMNTEKMEYVTAKDDSNPPLSGDKNVPMIHGSLVAPGNDATLENIYCKKSQVLSHFLKDHPDATRAAFKDPISRFKIIRGIFNLHDDEYQQLMTEITGQEIHAIYGRNENDVSIEFHWEACKLVVTSSLTFSFGLFSIALPVLIPFLAVGGFATARSVLSMKNFRKREKERKHPNFEREMISEIVRYRLGNHGGSLDRDFRVIDVRRYDAIYGYLVDMSIDGHDVSYGVSIGSTGKILVFEQRPNTRNSN